MVDLAEMRADFQPIAGDVLGVILFGSHAEGKATPRSDIDICIVGGPCARPLDTLELAWARARLGGKPYDLKAFEELPLHLEAEVIERGIVVVSRDEPGLGEYFVLWRRLWADQAHRNAPNAEDQGRIAAARRRR